MISHERVASILTHEAFIPQHAHEPMHPDRGVDFPRFPTGIAAIDDRVNVEGGYGATVIAGEGGVGKSVLAYSCAAQCVASGWGQVFVWDGENSEKQASMRLQGAFDRLGEPGWLNHLARNGGNLHLRKMRPSISLMHMASWVRDAMDPTMRTLVVIDSLNRLAKFIHRSTGRDYWRCLDDISLWITQVKDMTVGQVSFLMLSETNKDGTAKGRQIEFDADLAVSITKLSEPYRSMKIRKSRDGGEGDLGEHVLNIATSTFVRTADRFKPTIPAPMPEPPAHMDEDADGVVIPFPSQERLV